MDSELKLRSRPHSPKCLTAYILIRVLTVQSKEERRNKSINTVLQFGLIVPPGFIKWFFQVLCIKKHINVTFNRSIRLQKWEQIGYGMHKCVKVFTLNNWLLVKIMWDNGGKGIKWNGIKIKNVKAHTPFTPFRSPFSRLSRGKVMMLFMFCSCKHREAETQRRFNLLSSTRHPVPCLARPECETTGASLCANMKTKSCWLPCHLF